MMSVLVRSTTFYDFTKAIEITGYVTSTVVMDIAASLFVRGQLGIDSRSSYRAKFSFIHDLSSSAATPPGSEIAISEIDPGFVDVDKDDFRLARDSYAVNRIPAIVVVPPKDFHGCPRPAGGGSDPGAFESQP